MTVETEVANLTTAVDGLTSAVNVGKATLDASVADAEAAQTGAQSARDTTLGYKNSAEAAATSATSTASALTGFDLSAIDDTISDTATDVFVYDTSKDSDGGAWRKRTQHTSWYNETLNTSTRGSRREFPAVAVIVAESQTVTIYDGDDPSLPMWMVFSANGAGSGYLSNLDSSALISATEALNGTLTVGHSFAYAFAGLVVINFLSDSATKYNQSSQLGVLNLTIAERNNTGASPSVIKAVSPLVNYVINDVAMAVLPDAPIDAATGLQVPTIALATGGGISVIKDDGTVVDITGFAQDPDNVSFDSENNLISENAYSSELSVYAIPEADSTVSTFIRKYLSTANTSANNGLPKLLGNGGPYYKISGASSTQSGLTLLDRDMGAFITSDYNTGWMNGDIKLATLSDTDDTDAVGGELVTNSTFATDADWTLQSGWTIGGGTLNGGSSTTDAIYTATCVVGKTYVVSYEVTSYTSGRVFVRIDQGGVSDSTAVQAQSVGSYNHTFVAQTTSVGIALDGLGAYPFSGSIDNVSVRLAEADRSANNNGLQVNGTITKTKVATGADLVAYGPFGAINYLEMKDVSGLNFGTNDFSVALWIKEANSYSNVFNMGQVIAANNTQGNGIELTGSAYQNQVRFSTFENRPSGSTMYANPVDIPAGQWAQLVFVRKDGYFYTYLNGVLKDSIERTTQNITTTTETLMVGRRHSTTNPNGFDKKAALLRFSGTVPSPEQIAKMYEDEKVLFQENAQATLYGTTSFIRALTRDDTKKLLHVGTSQGRSVFQGLRRVENTTDAVGTAISASNGLVVEE
jgi:hypothetical protein